MIEKYRSYLYELGLSDIQINIYDYILTHEFGTINNIKTDLNYSYSQVHYNLSELEEMGLIFSSMSKKKKKFYKIRPKIALAHLLEDKFSDHKKKIASLDEKVRAYHSEAGRCVKTISFYHYDDINLAVENYFRLIQNTQKEIIISSLPPILFDKLESALYNAFMRGIQITIYFSQNDFIEIKNYLDQVMDILSRLSLRIIEVEEKTCQNVRYNDIIVNSGFFLIDEKYLNSILFKDNEIFHFDGFYSPNFVQMSKKMLKIKTIKKRIKLEYPSYVNRVLEILNEKSYKTEELSKESKIGGAKLKEVLDLLINEGKVEKSTLREGRGRPAVYYSLIDDK